MPILKDEGALQEYKKKGIQMIENVEVQWKQVTYVDVELRVFDWSWNGTGMMADEE